MFANIKEKTKALFKRKNKVAKPSKKADMQFFADHIEEFRFFVKYYSVFQDLAVKTGKNEIKKLNEAKPCVFRKESDIPFRCECEIKANDGESVKTIKHCKECKARKSEE